MRPAISILTVLLLPIVGAQIITLGSSAHTLVQLDVPDHAPPESNFTVSLYAEQNGATVGLFASLDAHGCDVTSSTSTPGTGNVAARWTLRTYHEACRLSLQAGRTGGESVYASATVPIGSLDEEASYWIPMLIWFALLIFGLHWRAWALVVLGIAGILAQQLLGLTLGTWSRSAILTFAALAILITGLWRNARDAKPHEKATP